MKKTPRRTLSTPRFSRLFIILFVSFWLAPCFCVVFITFFTENYNSENRQSQQQKEKEKGDELDFKL